MSSSLDTRPNHRFEPTATNAQFQVYRQRLTVVSPVALGGYRSMSPNRINPGFVIRRYPVAYLSDLVYFIAPMPSEPAETIRTLRRDHGLSYDQVMWALSESDPDVGQCVTFGKALTDVAHLLIQDPDMIWR